MNFKLNYVINRKKYERIEDVPSAFRHLLEDKNQNGVPDLLEGKPDTTIVTQSTQYVINGKTYSCLEDIPSDIRKFLDGKNKNENHLQPAFSAKVPFSDGPFVALIKWIWAAFLGSSRKK